MKPSQPSSSTDNPPRPTKTPIKRAKIPKALKSGSETAGSAALTPNAIEIDDDGSRNTQSVPRNTQEVDNGEENANRGEDGKRKKFHFCPSDDIALLKEVSNEEPYAKIELTIKKQRHVWQDKNSDPKGKKGIGSCPKSKGLESLAAGLG
ncbi:hypothetical protein HDU80_001193 [Chytriomyces hyalinus]|nr:hypothetical protein HDU80_001193 [Chytriomyces hyalinus]